MVVTVMPIYKTIYITSLAIMQKKRVTSRAELVLLYADVDLYPRYKCRTSSTAIIVSHTPLAPVSCLTRNIPRPSSMLLVFLIPITLFGRGLIPLPPNIPNCFVGLILLVGFKPPPTICLRGPESLPIPVNCRAIVVVPVSCAVTLADHA